MYSVKTDFKNIGIWRYGDSTKSRFLVENLTDFMSVRRFQALRPADPSKWDLLQLERNYNARALQKTLSSLPRRGGRRPIDFTYYKLSK